MCKVDDIHMLDGRRYFTTDGWQTIRADKPNGRRVTGDEEHIIRWVAGFQEGATRNENTKRRKT